MDYYYSIYHTEFNCKIVISQKWEKNTEEWFSVPSISPVRQWVTQKEGSQRAFLISLLTTSEWERLIWNGIKEKKKRASISLKDKGLMCPTKKWECWNKGLQKTVFLSSKSPSFQWKSNIEDEVWQQLKCISIRSQPPWPQNVCSTVLLSFYV